MVQYVPIVWITARSFAPVQKIFRVFPLCQPLCVAYSRGVFREESFEVSQVFRFLRNLENFALVRTYAYYSVPRGRYTQTSFRLAQPFPGVSALPAVTNKAANVPDL